jgi:hypothetical protein
MGIGIGLGCAEFPFSGAAAYWRWIDMCEAGGVDSIWQTDRIVSREPFLESMTMMAALAGRTRRMRFGMNVVSLTFRDPVLGAFHQKSRLDERQDFDSEFLHTREDFVGCRTAESKIDAADTNVAQRPDVGGDERRRTGQQAMFAITSLQWRGLAKYGAAQAQADYLRIAPRFGGHLA